jgi:hypothetical protein
MTPPEVAMAKEEFKKFKEFTDINLKKKKKKGK